MSESENELEAEKTASSFTADLEKADGSGSSRITYRYWPIWTPLLIAAAVFLFVYSPYVGVAFPANVDLPEHIIVSKLFWERIAGVSNLDTEISYFLGYRLSPILISLLITFCKVLGISMLSLPKLIVATMILFHVAAILPICFYYLKDRSESSLLYTIGLMLPAIVSIYSACWFIGFIGYMLAVTALVVTVFFTEKYLHRGKPVDALLLFIGLVIIYMAHPFAEIFWGFWCVGRSFSSVVNQTFLSEWKRLIVVAVLFAPIFVYNSVMTAGTELALGNRPLFDISPIITPDEWLVRIADLLSGTMIKADALAGSRMFAIVAIFLILSSLVLAYVWNANKLLRNLALSSFLLILISTWFNDKFIPGPGSLWIAWDFRFTSAVLVVCLAASGFVIVQLAASIPKTSLKSIVVLALTVIAFLGSLNHIWEVRKAYARHDAPARQFMEKVFSQQDPAGIWLPFSRWHPDGTLIRLYICLEQPDCNPDGTVFKSLGGNIWAVKFKSANLMTAPAATPAIPASPAPDRPIEPPNALQGAPDGSRQFASPRGLAADRKGNFYVADTGNARVQKFDPNGKLVMTIGQAGSEAGELRAPNGIAIDHADNIYVVDVGYGTLIKYGADGKFIKDWTGPEPGFWGPRDIAIGPNKHLYIVDQGRTRIVKFDPETESFTSWGTRGAGEGEFIESTGITIGDGMVFVADLGNNRIQVFDLEGKFIRMWAFPMWGSYPWHYPDLVFDEKAKRLYITNGWKKEILVSDANGNPIETGVIPDVGDELDNPSALCLVDANKKRRLLILNTGGNRVSQTDLAPTTKK